VGVDIDESGRKHLSCAVENVVRDVILQLSERDNAVLIDGHIRDLWRFPAAISDFDVSN
jgi:hypothetical protein